MESVQKIALGAAALCLAAGIWAAAAQKPLPMPEYPMEQAGVEAVLAETVFASWTVTGEEPLREDQRVYLLYDGQDRLVATVSTAENEEEGRVLHLAFLPDTAISAALPREEWGPAMRLAARLYGGFQNDGRIAESVRRAGESGFQVDADQSPPSMQLPEDLEILRWKQEVDGVTCALRFERWDLDAKTPAAQFSVIYLSGGA